MFTGEYLAVFAMDPLSVTASVAGVVSLAIQITQSLVDFYSACKDQKANVAFTVKKLERLLGVLEILSGQLSKRTFRADERDLLRNMEDSIQSCQECIYELRDQLDKFKTDSTGGFRETARTAARRLAYPFRQSTLQALEENVDEVTQHLSLSLQLLQQTDIRNVQNEVEDTRALLDLIRADQVSSTIRSWLRAPDPSVNYSEACKKRYPGTGLWLVTGSPFLSWLTKPNSFLWLNGFAGCGKSVLCSTSIQHIYQHRKSDRRVGIAFFFFTFSDESKQDASAMLRALVLQLSAQLNDGYALLSQVHRSYSDNMLLPAPALEDCLHQLVTAFKDVFIILDALDESPRDRHRGELLQVLANLRAWSETGLHLLVTSREEPDIRDMMYEDLCALPDEMIFLKNSSVDKDIASFISGSLKSDRRLRKWGKYHLQIEKTLAERAMGV